jgi:hypothetical protein
MAALLSCPTCRRQSYPFGYTWCLMCTLLTLLVLPTTYRGGKVPSVNHHSRLAASSLRPGEWVLNQSACIYYDEKIASDTRPLLITTDKHLVKLPVRTRPFTQTPSPYVAPLFFIILKCCDSYCNPRKYQPSFHGSEGERGTTC